MPVEYQGELGIHDDVERRPPSKGWDQALDELDDGDSARPWWEGRLSWRGHEASASAYLGARLAALVQEAGAPGERDEALVTKELAGGSRGLHEATRQAYRLVLVAAARCVGSPKRDIGATARWLIWEFLRSSSLVAFVRPQGEEEATRVDVVDLERGTLASVACEEGTGVATSVLGGPLVDRLEHFAVGSSFDLISCPTSFCTVLHEPLEAIAQYSIRGEGAADGYGHGPQRKTWVVNGKDVTISDVGRHTDPALVAQRRSSNEVWVRAGVGTVVNAEHGWAACVAFGRVLAFALDDGRTLLDAEFNASAGSIGSITLATSGRSLVVAYPAGDLVVYGAGVPWSLGKEASREDALWANHVPCISVCGDCLVRSYVGSSEVSLHRLRDGVGCEREPFATLSTGGHDVSSVVATAFHVIAECSPVGESAEPLLHIWMYGRSQEDVKLVYEGEPPVSGGGGVAAIVTVAMPDEYTSMSIARVNAACWRADADFNSERGSSLEGSTSSEAPSALAGLLPLEQERVSDEIWASAVERRLECHRSLLKGDRRIDRRSHDTFKGESLRTLDDLVLLTFSRHPKELDEALMGSAPAVMAMDEGADVRPPWANGAKIFVPGASCELLATAGVAELCPRHVLVRSNHVEDVHTALAPLPYRTRPRLKPGYGMRHLSYLNQRDEFGLTQFRDSTDAATVEEKDSAADGKVRTPPSDNEKNEKDSSPSETTFSRGPPLSSTTATTAPAPGMGPPGIFTSVSSPVKQPWQQRPPPPPPPLEELWAPPPPPIEKTFASGAGTWKPKSAYQEGASGHGTWKPKSGYQDGASGGGAARQGRSWWRAHQ